MTWGLPTSTFTHSHPVLHVVQDGPKICRLVGYHCMSVYLFGPSLIYVGGNLFVGLIWAVVKSIIITALFPHNSQIREGLA